MDSNAVNSGMIEKAVIDLIKKIKSNIQLDQIKAICKISREKANVRNLIFFLLISILLSGLVITDFISVHDKEEISMPINQSPLQVPESYNAASISKGTVLLLLAVGLIGVLGISRKRKELGNPAQRNETNREPNLLNMNEDKLKLKT